MAAKKEYPPLKDAIKSLENAMTVFTRECKSGSTWKRLNTISERIFERRETLEIVYKRTFPANAKPKKLRDMTTLDLVEAAKKRRDELEARK